MVQNPCRQITSDNPVKRLVVLEKPYFGHSVFSHIKTIIAYGIHTSKKHISNFFDKNKRYMCVFNAALFFFISCDKTGFFGRNNFPLVSFIPKSNAASISNSICVSFFLRRDILVRVYISLSLSLSLLQGSFLPNFISLDLKGVEA